MNALAPIAPKLGKLIPLLATNLDGEVVATVRAIERTLKSAGCDFHTLAKVVEDGPEPIIIYRERDPEPTSWSALAKWCRDNELGTLTPKEREFVRDMAARLVLRGNPTEKQADWLRSIYGRLQRGRS